MYFQRGEDKRDLVTLGFLIVFSISNILPRLTKKVAKFRVALDTLAELSKEIYSLSPVDYTLSLRVKLTTVRKQHGSKESATVSLTLSTKSEDNC